MSTIDDSYPNVDDSWTLEGPRAVEELRKQFSGELYSGWQGEWVSQT